MIVLSNHLPDPQPSPGCGGRFVALFSQYWKPSDRGSQYASGQYQAVLQAHRFTVSMSGTGNCFDNAAMESFFGTLKAEQIIHQSYQTRDQARQDIVSYVEGFYNVTRRHSTLGYRSPREFEQASAMA